MERAVAENPTEPRCLEELAVSYNYLAILLREAKRNREAEAAYRSSIAAWERRAGNFHLSFRQRSQSFSAYRSLAALLKDMGRRDEAAEIYTRELRLMLAMHAEFPDRTARDYLGSLRARNLGHSLKDLDRPQEAGEALRLAVSIAEAVIQQYPTLGPYSQQSLGRARNDFGALLMDTGRFEDAQHQLTQAIDIFGRLSADRSVKGAIGSPADNPEHLIELVTSNNNLGVLSTRAGRLKEANKAFSDAVSALRKLRTEFKTEHPIYKMQHERAQSWYADNLALYLMRLGNTHRDTNQFAEAETAYREAFAIRLKELPPGRGNSEQLAYLNTLLAEGLLRGGNNREAEKTLQEVAGAWEKLVNDADCRRELALVHHRLSLLHEKGGRKEEAKRPAASSNTAPTLGYHSTKWAVFRPTFPRPDGLAIRSAR
jgi:tetratricopeptide (TPR) repeat protein